jgi:general secretion pathway protein B
MSFILNALRKSEQERLAKQAESTGHKLIGKQEQIDNKKLPVWLIALFIINMCLMAYFVWSVMQKDNQSIETEKTIVTEKPKPLTLDTVISEKSRPLIQDKVVSEKLPPSTPKAIDTFKDPVINLAKQKEQAFIAQQIKERKAKKRKAKKLEEITSLENKQIISVKKQVESISVVEREKIESPKPVISKDEHNKIKEKEKEKEKENSPPFLSELPFEFRRSVPAIDFNVFVYSSIENERFVMIDMKKSQEGQEILEGMMLKEIRKNSIVVEYKNKFFQIDR